MNTAVCGAGPRLLLQKVDMVGTPEYMSGNGQEMGTAGCQGPII